MVKRLNIRRHRPRWSEIAARPPEAPAYNREVAFRPAPKGPQAYAREWVLIGLSGYPSPRSLFLWFGIADDTPSTVAIDDVDPKTSLVELSG
jgi:hypothetical protein